MNGPVKSLNWLILTALAMEKRAIAAELDGYIPSAGLSLQTIGIKAGRLNAELFGKFNGIVLAGLAGGLNPRLSVGDVIVETSANSPWNDLPFHAGKIHTSDHLIASIAEKERLFRDTGCDAVDMEGSLVRKLAESAGIPMLHIRAISDSADEAVPPDMINWINETGRPRPARIAANLALHPSQIPAMIRLGKNSHLALRNLTQALRRIVQSRIDS
jgi:adenosylhomocysteine nucleosidase